jgi:hypothetical protein
MDTRDYTQLLPIGDEDDTVWQALDRDENNIIGGHTQWQQSGGSCASAPFVCGYKNAPQNNWMITQHISRENLVEAVHETYEVIHIMINLTLDIPCPQNLPSCVNLSLYVWETSTQNEISAADTHDYRFIANISSGIQYLTVDFSSSQHSGFYLGIRDNGTCMIVNHVLVYVNVGCRAATVGLVRVSESVLASSSATVLGECVADSEPISETGPLLECSERGEWSVVSGCQCTAHHYLDSSGLLCLSMSPSAPQSLRVVDVTNTTATLSWTSPEYSGGRNSSEIHYTVTYTAPTTVVNRPLTIWATQIALTGLTPFMNYTFSVTAENNVSSHDTNVNARTSNTTATTLEGVAAQVTNVRVNEGGYIAIWSEPNPPHGQILYYNIKIIINGTETMKWGHNSTNITLDVWTNKWEIPAENVIIQVQAVTQIGPGEFSESRAVVTPTSATTISDSVNILTIFIVAIAVLVVLIISTVLFIIVCTKRRRKSSVTQDRTNIIEDYASVQLSPVSLNTKFTGDPRPPPVPSSPRPPQQRQDACDGHVHDQTYAVLEDPTQNNQYSFDPTDPTAGGSLMFGVASIDFAGEEVAPRCSGGNDATLAKPVPLYQVLEDPRNSSLITNRRKQKAPPPKHVSGLVVSTNTPKNSSFQSTSASDSIAQPESMPSGLMPSPYSLPAMAATAEEDCVTAV